ncbi:MAG: CAP domain-containing protein [Rhodomicrobiaceae bacterium]
MDLYKRLAVLLAALPLVTALLSASSAAEDTRLASLRTLALHLVNQSRQAHKLPPLVLDPKLINAAQSHADDMLKRNYYSHTSPEGKTVADRFQKAGGSRWVLTEENIAKCDGCAAPLTDAYVHRLHDGWMKSPGHRANILRPGIDRFGYGLAVSPSGSLYAVQTFAGPGAQDIRGKAAAKPISMQQQVSAALALINERRKSAGISMLEISMALSDVALSIATPNLVGDLDLPKNDAIYDHLPQGEKPHWSTLSLLGGACGGCGAQPVEADIAYFIKQWLSRDRYAKMLLDADATHLGFAVVADGNGKKIALGLLGQRH